MQGKRGPVIARHAVGMGAGGRCRGTGLMALPRRQAGGFRRVPAPGLGAVRLWARLRRG